MGEKKTLMGKSNRKREARACEACSIGEQSILFRVTATPQANWQLVCKTCQLSLKQNNQNYQYGGTWKQDKRN